MRGEIKMPLISVIVPVYNVEKYLEYCVDSIQKQTIKDIEIILVDDGSPDNSGVICDRLAAEDNRIVVIHKKNAGLSSARNAGIDVARGQYLGFVDSDDWIEPDMYEYLLNLIMEYDADIADCDMLETSLRDYTIQPQKDHIELLDRSGALDVFFRISKSNINYCVCDKLFKRDVFEQVRFQEGIIFEDIDFNYRALVTISSVVVSDSQKYYYFKNAEGISRNSFREKDLELLGVWDNIIALSEIQSPEYKVHAEFNRIRADFGLLCKMFKYGTRNDGGNYVDIRKNLLKSVRQHFWKLIKGKLPNNRKLLLILMVINYRLVEVPLSCIRKMREQK